jgi:hypothetical protein
VQGIARLVTLAVSGDSEEQLEEDTEREAAFAPDRNPIEISLSHRKRRMPAYVRESEDRLESWHALDLSVVNKNSETRCRRL